MYKANPLDMKKEIDKTQLSSESLAHHYRSMAVQVILKYEHMILEPYNE